MPFVKINYNLSDYLPANVPSTLAIDVVNKSFPEKIPNLSVYIPEVSIPEALSNKEQLANIPGVHSVLWLDDVLDIYQPLQSMDIDTVEAWYKDEGALFMLAGETEKCVAIIEEITDIYGDNAVLSGELLNQATIQSLSTGEVSQIMYYVVPLVLIVLLLTTSSWFEPILFLITIGIAILLNEGTNIFIGEVSYVTQSTSAVLQLAVSMDYAVFLLHSFSKYRNEGNTVETAMKKAMAESSSAIAASATTTVFGFLALALMKFQLGPNLGLVLAKGILFSFLSVMLLLPILAIYTTKLMDKTHHRSLIPSFKGFGRVVVRICIPLSFVFILLIVPNFLAQKNNDFIYGSSGIHSEDSQFRKDTDYINAIFGERQQMVLLVPDGDVVKEEAVSKSLEHIANINSIISYPLTVGTEIPPEFLSDKQLSQFRSGGYSRFILYA
ncbi:MAG: MMPL family transporter, partial [Parabacteroides sp.]|nr:MMPL family transporter [Parabacteroides sp.]